MEPAGGLSVVSGTLCGMAFHDLPSDWATRPLTDETVLTDVVDLVVADRNRVVGAVYALLCGPTDRLLQPCAVTDTLGGPAGPRELLDAFLREVANSMDRPGIVLAIARGGRPVTTDDDRRWHETAVELRRTHGVRLLAVVVATTRGVWRLPALLPDEAQPA